MRYHVLIVDDYDQGRTVIYPASHSGEPSPRGYAPVHVFRDDELDGLADAILRAAYTNTWQDRDAVLYVLRNHTSERQPGSADGAG